MIICVSDRSWQYLAFQHIKDLEKSELSVVQFFLIKSWEVRYLTFLFALKSEPVCNTNGSQNEARSQRTRSTLLHLKLCIYFLLQRLSSPKCGFQFIWFLVYVPNFTESRPILLQIPRKPVYRIISRRIKIMFKISDIHYPSKILIKLLVWLIQRRFVLVFLYRGS